MSDKNMSDKISITDLPEQDREFLRQIYEQAKTHFEALVARHGMKPGLGAALAPERIALLSQVSAPIHGAMEQAGTPVHCKRGCGFCCSLTIDVTPDEVFALAQYLEAHLPAADLAALKRRAEANDARGHGLAPLERHRLRMPCPVQDPATAACLGHAARPNGCQGYLSLNVAQCEADHDAPPQRIMKPVASQILANVVSDTRKQVLADAGAPRQSLELTAALVAYWRDPDAETRWLAGEEVLTSARSYPESNETT